MADEAAPAAFHILVWTLYELWCCCFSLRSKAALYFMFMKEDVKTLEI